MKEQLAVATWLHFNGQAQMKAWHLDPPEKSFAWQYGLGGALPMDHVHAARQWNSKSKAVYAHIHLAKLARVVIRCSASAVPANL